MPIIVIIKSKDVNFKEKLGWVNANPLIIYKLEIFDLAQNLLYVGCKTILT